MPGKGKKTCRKLVSEREVCVELCRERLGPSSGSTTGTVTSTPISLTPRLGPQFPHLISNKKPELFKNRRSPVHGDQGTLFTFVGKETSRILAFTFQPRRCRYPTKAPQPSSQALPWQPAAARGCATPKSSGLGRASAQRFRVRSFPARV